MKDLTWVDEVIKTLGAEEGKMGQEQQREVWNKSYQNYEM